MKTIGIIGETKNDFERRVAITPEAAKTIINKGHKVIVQPSTLRIFPEEEYKNAGCEISHDLSKCDIVFGVKEITEKDLIPGAIHIFFSHTIKGQDYNMPMLKEYLRTKSSILDYEPLVDSDGRRLVFFGKYAGLAGMVDSLHFLGQKLKYLGHSTILEKIKKSLDYESLAQAKEDIKKIGNELKNNPFPEEISPLTILVAGYGNVGKGCFEILENLPVEYIEASQLEEISKNYDSTKIYVVVLKEKDLVARISDNGFDLNEYFTEPDKYKSIADDYFKYATMYMNAIYWSPENPIFLSKENVKKLYQSGNKKLIMVGDITCDIGGSVEFNIKATTPGNPVYTYNPVSDSFKDGYESDGITVLAVDNLPCEFPKDSSTFFCNALMRLIDDILDLDKKMPANEKTPEVLKRAIICQNGELTEKYKYLEKELFGI